MTKPDARRRRIYERALPGGGFVAIDAEHRRSLLRQRRYRATVVLERRGAGDRRAGHAPPVLAAAMGASVATVFDQLFPLTQSNTELASRCLCLRRERPRLDADAP